MQNDVSQHWVSGKSLSWKSGGGGHFIVDNEDFNIKWDIKYEYL